MKFPIAFSHCFAPIVVATISVLLFLLEPTSSDYLAFQRDAFSDGEIWRLITGNLIHTNANHLFLNLAGLLLLWAIHGFYYSISNYLYQFVFFSIVVTSLIYLFNPQMLWYAGLSGVLHGFFVWGAYQDIRHKVRFGWLLMVGVWLKVGYEQIYGQDTDLANFIDANVAVDSHLYGAIAGIVVVLMFYLINKLPIKS